MKEIRVFDPHRIKVALTDDIVSGLRALADAIELREMDGRLLKFEGVGAPKWDHRAHMRITLDVAGEVMRTVEAPDCKELP